MTSDLYSTIYIDLESDYELNELYSDIVLEIHTMESSIPEIDDMMKALEGIAFTDDDIVDDPRKSKFDTSGAVDIDFKEINNDGSAKKKSTGSNKNESLNEKLKHYNAAICAKFKQILEWCTRQLQNLRIAFLRALTKKLVRTEIIIDNSYIKFLDNIKKWSQKIENYKRNIIDAIRYGKRVKMETRDEIDSLNDEINKCLQMTGTDSRCTPDLIKRQIDKVADLYKWSYGTIKDINNLDSSLGRPSEWSSDDLTISEAIGTIRKSVNAMSLLCQKSLKCIRQIALKALPESVKKENKEKSEKGTSNIDFQSPFKDMPKMLPASASFIPEVSSDDPIMEETYGKIKKKLTEHFDSKIGDAHKMADQVKALQIAIKSKDRDHALKICDKLETTIDDLHKNMIELNKKDLGRIFQDFGIGIIRWLPVVYFIISGCALGYYYFENHKWVNALNKAATKYDEQIKNLKTDEDVQRARAIYSVAKMFENNANVTKNGAEFICDKLLSTPVMAVAGSTTFTGAYFQTQAKCIRITLDTTIKNLETLRGKVRGIRAELETSGCTSKALSLADKMYVKKSMN